MLSPAYVRCSFTNVLGHRAFPLLLRAALRLPTNLQNQNLPSRRSRTRSLASRSRRRPSYTSRTTSTPSSTQKLLKPLLSVCPISVFELQRLTAAQLQRRFGRITGNATLIICPSSPLPHNSIRHTSPLPFPHRSHHRRTRRTLLNRRRNLATTFTLTLNTILVRYDVVLGVIAAPLYSEFPDSQ